MVLRAVTAVALIAATAACSKSSPAAQARSRDDAAKPVKVEPVKQESIRRSVEVVGTLSAEAEGRVSRLLADLGDRVIAGQALVELDREKPQYNFDQQKAALGRALAKFGATDTAHLPPFEKTPDVQRASGQRMGK